MVHLIDRWVDISIISKDDWKILSSLELCKFSDHSPLPSLVCLSIETVSQPSIGFFYFNPSIGIATLFSLNRDPSRRPRQWLNLERNATTIPRRKSVERKWKSYEKTTGTWMTHLSRPHFIISVEIWLLSLGYASREKIRYQKNRGLFGANG